MVVRPTEMMSVNHWARWHHWRRGAALNEETWKEGGGMEHKSGGGGSVGAGSVLAEDVRITVRESRDEPMAPDHAQESKKR